MSLNVVYLRLLGYCLATKNAVVKNLVLIAEFSNKTVWFSHSVYSLSIILQKPKKFVAHNSQLI